MVAVPDVAPDPLSVHEVNTSSVSSSAGVPANALPTNTVPGSHGGAKQNVPVAPPDPPDPVTVSNKAFSEAVALPAIAPAEGPALPRVKFISNPSGMFKYPFSESSVALTMLLSAKNSPPPVNTAACNAASKSPP